MIFLNLIVSEIKYQFRNTTFFVFIIVVVLFYSYQYCEEANRLKPPDPNLVYSTIEATSKEEKLVLGYKELYGSLKSKNVIKYAPIAKKVKLTDKQLQHIEKFIVNMAPNTNVLTIEPKDIKIDYESMIDYMNSLDSELGGNTVLGPKYRQFIRAMTYEESLIEYESQKDDGKITAVYARMLADYLGISAGLFVVFLSSFSLLRDKYWRTQELIFSSNVKSIVYVGAKFIGLFISVMSVFLTIGLIETTIFLFQANMYNATVNFLDFFKYIIAWVAPTVMFGIILPMLIAIIAENSIFAIVVKFCMTLILLFNTELTGQYDFTRFIIRFNGNNFYQQFASAIKYNRLFYVGISLMLILLTTFIWEVKRNKVMGGILHGN